MFVCLKQQVSRYLGRIQQVINWMLKVKRLAICMHVFNRIYRQSNFQIKIISKQYPSNEKIEVVWDSIELTIKNITLQEILSKIRSKVKRML